jgi:hypothetical protein
MRGDGESFSSAASRIMAEVEDSTFNLLLKLKHPEKVTLKLVTKEKQNLASV